MKHLRPNELDDEQRALHAAVRHFDYDEEEAAIVAEGSYDLANAGVTYLNEFGCCPRCKQGPFGPTQYVCQNLNCSGVDR